jgi:hypothetical protein
VFRFDRRLCRRHESWGRHEGRGLEEGAVEAPFDELGPALDTIAEACASTVHLGADGRGRFQAPRDLQSWPGIVHGGGLLALLDAAATRLGWAAGSRLLEGRLTSSVPVDTALALEGQADGDAVRLAIVHDGHVLTSGIISAVDPRDATGHSWPGGDDGWSLPVSEHCLACGALNPLGLQMALRFDDTGVWARLPPRAPWRAPDGRLHQAVAPVLLDEIAWWLGALVMKEGGLTNRIDLTLHRPDMPFGPVLVGGGRFEAVQPVDRRRTFWRTETVLMAADGALIATASIVFRGGPEYSARQMDYFRPRTPPDIFRRMFPNYSR